MNTPLLTSDGFPRDDIDIVQGKRKKKKKDPLVNYRTNTNTK